MKEYNKKEAKFYGNMFAKMSKLGSLESNVSMQLKLILLIATMPKFFIHVPCFASTRYRSDQYVYLKQSHLNLKLSLLKNE